MSSPMSPQQILDREYLELRAKILELAASLDRLQRARQVAGASVPLWSSDPRCELLQGGLQILLAGEVGDRAEQVQLLFSREYDPEWRTTLGVTVTELREQERTNGIL